MSSTKSLRPCIALYFGVVLTLLAAGCDQNMLKTGDADVNAGMVLFEQRKFEMALPLFEKALQSRLRAYSKSDVLTTIGNCHLELEKYEEALKYHDLAIKEDPNNHQALVNKGILCRQTGDYDQAEELYRKALKIQPNYAELHASLGALYVFQGRHDDAVRSLERAIELDASLPVAHSNLAMAYALVGRFDDADAQLKLARKTGYHQPDLIEKEIQRLRDLDSGGAR